MNCHPERSVAEPRDLRCALQTPQILEVGEQIYGGRG
jgi:hypothetical protein